MYGIQFEDQHGSERSKLALVGDAVHSLIPISLIPIVDRDLKVAPDCPLINRNDVHNVGNFTGVGGK